MADLNGANFTVDAKTGEFTLKGKLDKTGKISGSGKSRVYYSTGGNVDVEGGYAMGVNIYKKI